MLRARKWTSDIGQGRAMSGCIIAVSRNLLQYKVAQEDSKKDANIYWLL